MKKFIVILLVLIYAFSIPAAAFAANESSGSADGKYANIAQLYQYWERNGYPDYVGSVFSTDGSQSRLTVLLVDDDGTMEDQIRRSLIDDSDASFGMAQFSHNELEAVADEIVSNYLGKKDKVYGIGVGWTSVDGKTAGFGASGKESRVVVSVDKSVLEKYTNKFHALYGDMVVVEAGHPAQIIATSANSELLPMLISLLVLVGAITLFFNRNRLIPAMQVVTGTVVAHSAHASRKQTIEAIKNSEIPPGDEVFNSILHRIDKQ